MGVGRDVRFTFTNPTRHATLSTSTPSQVPPSVAVWKSVLFTSASEPAIVWFERIADVPVDAATGTFVIAGLHPDTILSVTSLDRGQRHGSVDAPPVNVAFPTPYTDDFQGYQPEKMVCLLACTCQRVLY